MPLYSEGKNSIFFRRSFFPRYALGMPSNNNSVILIISNNKQFENCIRSFQFCIGIKVSVWGSKKPSILYTTRPQWNGNTYFIRFQYSTNQFFSHLDSRFDCACHLCLYRWVSKIPIKVMLRCQIVHLGMKKPRVKNMISCSTKSNLYQKKTEIETETDSPDIS